MNSNIRTPYKYERVYEPNSKQDKIALDEENVRDFHPEGCWGLQSEWYCGYARSVNFKMNFCPLKFSKI